MSFKRISHEDSLGECNSVKVFADIIFKQQVKVGQLHSACYEYISKLLAGIDKDGLIIIGVFASS